MDNGAGVQGMGATFHQSHQCSLQASLPPWMDSWTPVPRPLTLPSTASPSHTHPVTAAFRAPGGELSRSRESQWQAHAYLCILQRVLSRWLADWVTFLLILSSYLVSLAWRLRALGFTSLL